MGKGKPKIEVTEYYLSQHFGICLAEPDALIDVLVKEKSIIDAPITAEGITAIDKPDLFGGVKKEGGAIGNMRYMPGADDQLMPDLLAQKLGRAGSSDCPGYRGIASLFFYGSGSRGFYWTANTPFVPGVWAKVRRILKRANGSAQWYPEKAEIDTCSITLEPELRMRLVFTGLPQENRFDSELVDRPSNGWILKAASSGTSNGRTQLIDESEAETTTLDTFCFVRSSQFIEFVWRDPADLALLYENEIELTVQFGAGDLSDPATYALQLYDPITETFSTLTPKAKSETIRPGTSSRPSSGGVINARNLWPDRVYYDMPEAPSLAGALDMNPAHIIHECLTDREFGMGTPTSAIDDVAFRAAADTLHTEGFGLSMIWTRQSEIQKFINEVLDHIQAVLFTDPRTGLLVLKLIRDDYDAGTLPVIDPDTADLSNFGRKLWGDIINEIIVTWTNPLNEQDETITVQDNASIAVQGGVVSDSRNYYGVRCANLAQRLAYRDLRSAGQPLASCEAAVDRSQYDLTPGSVIKVTWPEYGLTELVMRVQSVDYGRPGEPEIRLQLIEDVYGLDVGSYDTPPATSWQDPSQDPSQMEPVQILTLPYYMAANSEVLAELGEPTYPSVVAGILGSSTNPDAWEYDLLDEVALPSGDLVDEVIATNNVIGRALLADPGLPAEATSTAVSLTGIIGNTTPALGGFAIIGTGIEATDEIAMIIADNGDGTYDLARGVLDTVPRAWPAGTSIYFVDEGTVFEDPLLRSAGEVVDYKLLMRTSKGTFPAASATLRSHTLTERPYLPLRPADVQIDGEAFSSQAAPLDQTAAYIEIPITWANRNRLTEDSQVLQWGDATVTPETGQTTSIEVRDISGTLITAHTGLTGTSFDLPLTSFGSENLAEVRIFSVRTDGDGTFASLQFVSEWVRVAGVTRRTEDNFERITEAGDVRELEG